MFKDLAQMVFLAFVQDHAKPCVFWGIEELNLTSRITYAVDGDTSGESRDMGGCGDARNLDQVGLVTA